MRRHGRGRAAPPDPRPDRLGPVGLAFDALDFAATDRARLVARGPQGLGRPARRPRHLPDGAAQVLELDAGGGEVEIRSQAPTARGEARGYYEVRLNRQGILRLARFAFDEADRQRRRTACHADPRGPRTPGRRPRRQLGLIPAGRPAATDSGRDPQSAGLARAFRTAERSPGLAAQRSSYPRRVGLDRRSSRIDGGRPMTTRLGEHFESESADRPPGSACCWPAVARSGRTTPRPEAADAQADVVRGRQVRPLRPLGRLLAAGQGRVGDGATTRSRSPSTRSCRRGSTRPSSTPSDWAKLAKAAGMKLHHDHEQAPRRLLHVRQQAHRLRHRRRHPVRQGPPEGPGRRLSASRRSSSSSIIRCSTGTIPTTSRGARRASTRAARTRAIGRSTSPITRARSASSAPITARSAASGSTAGGTGPTPTGTSKGPTG